jgi:hypothetical protein
MSLQSFNPETGHLTSTPRTTNNRTSTPPPQNNNGGWWAFVILLIAFVVYIIVNSDNKQTPQAQNYNSQYSQPAYPTADTTRADSASPANLSATSNTTSLDTTQSEQQVNNETENTNRVDFTGKMMIVQVEKTYFHNEPSVLTRRKGFIEKGQVVTIIESQNGFGRCSYTDLETQITSEGWLQLSDLYVNE